ncbi:MAG: LacI family DNA-binding transcriptional regulator [Blautia sp.]|nr:LacI family DNA-binding transcriptional regulator [Blautia sp.]
MVSMKEIAKRCNVSVATVSKALNGYTDIGESTRRLVMSTASEAGYLPNSSARALKTKRTFNLGVIFVDQGMSGLTHEYFNHVLDSFKKRAEAQGYDITFACTRIADKQMSYYEHCRYRGVDGVVMACVDFDSAEIRELVQSSLPIVTIDHVFDGHISIVSNNVQGMEALVSYICECGHRRIAYIHGENTSPTKARLAGYYRTLQRYGISAVEAYVQEGSYRNPELAEELTAKLLNMKEPPTCIMYSDDYAAMGGINEIRMRGMKIPEDISVAGYDGIDFVRIMEPRLTTLCQDTDRIGKLAADRLIDLIEHPKTALVDKYMVDGTLFKGGSVKKLRQIHIA